MNKTYKQIFKAVSLVFLVLIINGCQVNPTTGDSNLHIISNEKAIQEAALAYSSLLSSSSTLGPIDSDVQITNRVNQIFARLLPEAKKVSSEANDWNWEVHVVSTNEINAWCMAGGKIAVFTGLVKQLNTTDDELAFVIAHEIGHALGGHTAAEHSMQILTNIGLLTYNSKHANNPQLQEKVQSLSKLLVTLPYSRIEETQADKIGLDLMTRAGYVPEASISVWEKWIKLGGQQVPEFQSGHPSHENRIATLKGLINTVKTAAPQQETLGLVADDFDKFKTGKANLNCTLACGFGNGSNRKSIQELYSNQRWKDLAIVVIKVNYEKDLNYFYLGRAAEALGYKVAAETYYNKAIELSGTSKRCGYVFKYQCNGIDVPSESSDALNRLKQ